MLNNVEQAVFTSEQILGIIREMLPQIEASIREVYNRDEAELMIDGASIMNLTCAEAIKHYQQGLMALVSATMPLDS